jgi:dihydrofolate reductase
LQKIKEEPGKDIWLLGAGLITAVIHLNLIDVYRVYVHPVVLGSDTTPLFSNTKQKLKLQLLQTRSYKSGVGGLYYQPEL